MEILNEYKEKKRLEQEWNNIMAGNNEINEEDIDPKRSIQNRATFSEQKSLVK